MLACAKVRFYHSVLASYSDKFELFSQAEHEQIIESELKYNLGCYFLLFS